MTDKKKNFYEILNLRRDCKANEIKESFIKLSKQHHPDKNINGKYSHEKFLHICEAYNTLKNPVKRMQYDQHLSLKSHMNYDPNRASGKSYGFSSSTHSSPNMNNNKFLLKLALLPKVVIFAALIFISAVSARIQYGYIYNKFDHRRSLLQNKSLMASLFVEKAREQAKMNGKEEQLRKLQEGLLGKYDITEILDQYIKESSSEAQPKQT